MSKITLKERLISKKTGKTDNFWGDGISEFPIDPETEQKIKRKYMRKIHRWKTTPGFSGMPGGTDITKIQIVPLKGKINTYGDKLIYRVYYGKGIYDEYSTNSHSCELNPDTMDWTDPEDRNCPFCQMPADHSSCGYGCHKEDYFDKIINKLNSYS